MQNFSAVRRAVRRPFQKSSWGLPSLLHWRGLKLAYLELIIDFFSIDRFYAVLLPVAPVVPHYRAEHAADLSSPCPLPLPLSFRSTAEPGPRHRAAPDRWRTARAGRPAHCSSGAGDGRYRVSPGHGPRLVPGGTGAGAGGTLCRLGTLCRPGTRYRL